MKMWKNLNREQMVAEEHMYSLWRSSEEVEQLVVMERLKQYNQARSCGAQALRKRLKELYRLNPLPSERTIGRILARHGLTARRTGWYAGDDRAELLTPTPR
jgi:hypothetical protein